MHTKPSIIHILKEIHCSLQSAMKIDNTNADFLSNKFEARNTLSPCKIPVLICKIATMCNDGQGIKKEGRQYFSCGAFLPHSLCASTELSNAIYHVGLEKLKHQKLAAWSDIHKVTIDEFHDLTNSLEFRNKQLDHAFC